MTAARRRVVLSANSSWNIVNFRKGLIAELKTAGYEPVVVTPVGAVTEQRMRELGVEQIVVDCLGETDDVRPFIASATAVVLPSYREGLPRSLLEAGAMGWPLIATDVPGCREVVEAGVNGFLCGPRDPASLADAMTRLVELSPERRSDMGRASRLKVEKKFSEDAVIGGYLDALGKVAAPES